MGETEHWWPIVSNLIHGNGYSACFPVYFPFCGPDNQTTAAREPLPVLLFATVAVITNESMFAAALLELLLNLGVAWSVFLLACSVSNRRTALVAAFLWAVYLPGRESLPQISGELPAALCVTFAAYFIVRAHARNRARDWLAAGLFLALGALCRSVVIVIAPVMMAFVLLSPGGPRTPRAIGPRLRAAAILVAVVVTALSPWLVRNYLAFNHVVIGSTLTGYNLYRFNHILATDDYLRFVGDPSVSALVSQHADLDGTENEAEMDKVYRAEALRIVREEPLRYLTLSLYRFPMLWFNWGVNRGYGVADSGWDDLVAAEQAVLLVAAAIGAWRRRRARPLWLSVASVSLAHMIVAAKLRFLVPMMPLVAVLSAVGLVWIGRATLNRRLRPTDRR